MSKEIEITDKILQESKTLKAKSSGLSGISRRHFLKAAVAIGATAAIADLTASPSWAFVENIPFDRRLNAYVGFYNGIIRRHSVENNDGQRFVYLRLKYAGGDWHTDVADNVAYESDVRFSEELAKATSIDIEQEGAQFITLDDENLYSYPFLYMTGHMSIQFEQSDINRLRIYLQRGGFLFAEDCDVRRGTFDRAFRREMRKVLPQSSLQQLDISHPIYHSFFQLNEIMGGDKLVYPYDEGIFLDGRLAVFYCPNDLGCAWEGHPCNPGGEEQRRWAFKMGINMVTYALTH